ncbi:MAG: hypothetical protein HY827_00985 [Actinobacteria bacterium]|nr:hypothetical protein [Actinomycetota bacterium]
MPIDDSTPTDSGDYEISESADAKDGDGDARARARDDSSKRRSEAPPRRPGRARPRRTGGYYAWLLAPLVAFAVLVALILNTGTPSAGDLMRQASTSFGDVERGTFNFKMSITPKGSATAETSTISLSGPFELIPGKPLPLAKINYTVTSGERSQEVVLLTTGEKAYTVIQGQAYELPASATKDLRKATKQLSSGDSGKSKPKQNGLTGLKLNFDRWLENPRVGSGSEIDGTSTWRTSAAVDVVAALKDLSASAKALGGVTGAKVPELTEDDIKQLKSSFRNAKVIVYVGRYDRIVRLLDLTMDFTTPAEFASTTGGITGGRLNLRIGISRPNKPVNVKPPSSPLPFKALQSLGQGGSAGTALDDGLGK